MKELGMVESVKRSRLPSSPVADVDGRVRASQEACQNGQTDKSDEIVKIVTVRAIGQIDAILTVYQGAAPGNAEAQTRRLTYEGAANMTYQVIDIRTKQVVRSYDNRRAASRAADRLDQQYGAVRYIVRAVETL